MTYKLNYFIREQVRANGLIYFMFNYKACMAHCHNRKRQWDEANDPIRQAAIARYVDALHDAGDLR